jgi:nucleotide-binding universal stress UspA family protein
MGDVMLVLSPTRHNPRSVDLAMSLAQTSQRPLLAVFVIDTRVTDAISERIVDVGFLGDKVSSQLEAAILEEYEDRGRRDLEDVRGRAEKMGIECEILIRRGDFLEECLRVAKERNAQDIIVSRAERSNVSRKIFGSAVNELLERAPCPVMVVSDGTVENHRDLDESRSGNQV